ncbi:helical backbone metal receptor [Streptomyces sp. Tue6028]|uniref:helical backbone metal receptor n=1 Tax=Streptomyces sp. Tue6028 TaxID=2036037 RepID=UPI003D704953
MSGTSGDTVRTSAATPASPSAATPTSASAATPADQPTAAPRPGRTPPRVVSLVPSLTEAVALSVPGALVGATDWCSRPADLDVVRVGGTKNPDVGRIVRLAPDLVVANEEENREPDLTALREAGIEVLVTEVRDVPGAFRELARVLDACRPGTRPRWLDEAEAAWTELPEPARRTTAIVPIWRRPWMVLGRDTFAGDVLARLGVDNAYAGHADRYPRVPLPDLRAAAADLVVLPDEPYRFTADDGPEAFEGLPCALVDGRMLTWYGPSLAEAPAVLSAALRAAWDGASRGLAEEG